MEIRADLHDREEIRRYLKHIGLSEHPPPIAPARYEQQRLELNFDEVSPAPEETQRTPDYH